MTAAVSGDTVEGEDDESVVVPAGGCAAVSDLVDEIGAMVGLLVEDSQDVASRSAV